MVWTYEKVVETIEGKRRFENLPGVEVSRRMLDDLRLNSVPFVHIAGTNGKGSVSAFLCQIFEKAGLTVGMFTSPHLKDFRERIRVNGEPVEKEAVCRLGRRLLEHDFGVRPTMFDYCLVMAVLYFKEKHCDVAVYETGLGGRLDSTNALGVPRVSLLTKIGYDHTAILGDTLTKIASEKAGILKAGTELVMESQSPEAEKVILKAAKAVGVSKISRVCPEEIEDEGFDGERQSFSYSVWKHLSIRLLGVHQYENAAAAVLAAAAWFGESLQKEWVADGLRDTLWPGRMQILGREPFFLVDGAHNGNGTAALADSLRRLFPGEKFHFIMGVMADKDYEDMVTCLLPLALDFKTVTVESERSLRAERLAECIRAKGVPAESLPGEMTASDMRAALPADGTKTVAFGSLYFVGTFV